MTKLGDIATHRLGTRRNVRRSRFEKCSGTDADYLRVLGNRGAADAFYCGDSAPNATFAAGDAVALLFKSNPRQVDEGGAGSRLEISFRNPHREH